jgi:hypothetical protein
VRLVDPPKDEFGDHEEAARYAATLASHHSGLVNVWSVVDGDLGEASEHELA